MQSMIRAEWLKTTGNRWVMGTLLLLFPIMAVIIVLITTLVAAGGRPEALVRLGLPGPGQAAYWPDYFLYSWIVPSSPIGRWLLIALAAVVFGGEYKWRTWKGLLGYQPRWALILAKFLTTSLLILAAFLAASLIMGVGMLLPVSVAGGTVGPALSGPVLGDFLTDYAARMGLALLSALLATGYAALAALLTRTILGSVLIAMGVFMLEEVLPGLLGLLGMLLHRPEVVALFQLTPAYNLQNLLTWRLTGVGYTNPVLSLYAAPNSPALSVAILVGWVILIVGVSIMAFARQDITG